MNIKSSLVLTFSWISSKNVRLSTYSTVLLGIASSLNCASWQNSIRVSVLFLASLGKISLITYTKKNISSKAWSENLNQTVFYRFFFTMLLVWIVKQRFRMKSRRPYWCPKTLKRRPCWCPSSPVGVELFSYVKTFFCSNKFAWMLVGEHALDKPCYYRKTQWRVKTLTNSWTSLRAYLRGGGLNTDRGGLFVGGGELIQLWKDDGISPQYRNRVQSRKAQVQEVGGHATENQKQIRTSN